MYEIAICDDDSAFAQELEEMLSELFLARGVNCRVSRFSDPSQLMNALERGANCDLLFQDILFGEERGLRFARLVRERKWDLDLVFVTSSEEYAVAGYDVRPLHYLLKPIRREQLEEAVDRFLERRTPCTLCLTTPTSTVRLPISEILYFEIYNHTVVIHLRDGGDRSWRCTLHDLESMLPPEQFVRIHRSFLVNLEHIAEIERDRVRLTSGDYVPISKNAYANLQLSLVAFDRRRHASG